MKMMNELIVMFSELAHDCSVAPAAKALEALKEYNLKAYENVTWALGWGQMNWAEVAEYLQKEVK